MKQFPSSTAKVLISTKDEKLFYLLAWIFGIGLGFPSLVVSFASPNYLIWANEPEIEPTDAKTLITEGIWSGCFVVHDTLYTHRNYKVCQFWTGGISFKSWKVQDPQLNPALIMELDTPTLMNEFINTCQAFYFLALFSHLASIVCLSLFEQKRKKISKLALTKFLNITGGLLITSSFLRLLTIPIITEGWLKKRRQALVNFSQNFMPIVRYGWGFWFAIPSILFPMVGGIVLLILTRKIIDRYSRNKFTASMMTIPQDLRPHERFPLIRRTPSHSSIKKPILYATGGKNGGIYYDYNTEQKIRKGEEKREMIKRQPNKFINNNLQTHHMGTGKMDQYEDIKTQHPVNVPTHVPPHNYNYYLPAKNNLPNLENLKEQETHHFGNRELHGSRQIINIDADNALESAV
ncbi:hypothetical protein SNEBB_000278 [Seison nebaliae]|nr:hypothetical protein SNEBB_000278 [Seison nebaliae]